jgi:hypothetical protein
VSFPVVEVGRSENGFVRIDPFRILFRTRFGQKFGGPVVRLPRRVGVAVAVASGRELRDVNDERAEPSSRRRAGTSFENQFRP